MTNRLSSAMKKGGGIRTGIAAMAVVLSVIVNAVLITWKVGQIKSGLSEEMAETKIELKSEINDRDGEDTELSNQLKINKVLTDHDLIKAARSVGDHKTSLFSQIGTP